VLLENCVCSGSDVGVAVEALTFVGSAGVKAKLLPTRRANFREIPARNL
jgi:hypothetical protein